MAIVKASIIFTMITMILNLKLLIKYSDCENIDDCVNEGFMHENGVQECLKICEGVISTSFTQSRV